MAFNQGRLDPYVLGQEDSMGSMGFDYEKQHHDGIDDKVMPDGTETAEVFSSIAGEEEVQDSNNRTMSWQRTTLLLFGDQVCLAITSQPWTFKVLGWVPALITTVVCGIVFWISSHTLWQFVMKHPQIRDVGDVGYLLFGRNRLAYMATMFMLLGYNIIFCGFHILMGTQVLNAVTDHSLCTAVFGVIVTLICIVISIPRTLGHVSIMSIGSAICMGLAILLFMIFVGIEDHPASGMQGAYPVAGPVKTYAFPQPGTTWIDCVNAVLNITFLWFAQILFPSFIAEMRQPRDFPKALTIFTLASFALFIVPAIVGFYYLGQYAQAPAFGSLQHHYKQVSFGPVIVATTVIGSIYANVSVKFIYRLVLHKAPHHQTSNTIIGWSTWLALIVVFWFIAYIFAEVIPSMGDFQTLLGAAFDSHFGLTFWAVTYWHLYRGRFFDGFLRSVLTLIHIFILLAGFFLWGPGLYVAVQTIITDYSGGTRPVFSCANLSP